VVSVVIAAATRWRAAAVLRASAARSFACASDTDGVREAFAAAPRLAAAVDEAVRDAVVRLESGADSGTSGSSIAADFALAADFPVDRAAGFRVAGFRAAGFGFTTGFDADSTASEVAGSAGAEATVSVTRSAADFVARGLVAAVPAAEVDAAAGFAAADFAGARLAAADFAAAVLAAGGFAADFAGARLAGGFEAVPSDASSFAAAPPFRGAPVLVRADPDRGAVRLAAALGSAGVAAASPLPISGATDAPRSADTPVPVPSGVSSSGPDRETEVTTTTYQVGPPPPPNPLHAAPHVAHEETGRALGITSRNRHDVRPG
jgi:hypothetical protein